MANEENLKKGNPATQFHKGRGNGRGAVENGEKSGAARRRKKTLREIANAIGEKTPPEAVLENLKKNGLIDESEQITSDEAIMLAQYAKAFSGNTRAADHIAKVKGELVTALEVSAIDDKSLERMREDFSFADDV